MKPSLQCQMGHSLSLAPQLQHAIKLLHMSAIELQEEIQKLLESNPMLETDETPAAKETNESVSAEVTEKPSTEKVSDHLEFQIEEGPWQEFSSRKTNSTDSVDTLEFMQPTTESLQDYLHWQCRLTPLLPEEHEVARVIIDAIDDEGYLVAPISEIINSTTLCEPPTEAFVESVLAIIQSFDPAGVGARNLKECLLLQLKQMHTRTPSVTLSSEIVENHLALLSTNDFQVLLKVCDCTKLELKSAIELIKSLHPKPGRLIGEGKVAYIVPDVVVKKEEGFWQVKLNHGVSPKLKLNQYYMQFIKRADNSRDNAFLKDNLKEARWFLKSLENRNDTLIRVARCIVEKQSDFLEKGEADMKPLVLQDVAKELDLHESTISRITTQKYLHTPRGVFELKYFFSSHVTSGNGQAVSSTAIRALIKKYIATESPEKPLSDSKLAAILAIEHGIDVARRTVTKYREALMIAPSNERKRMLATLEAD